jgi:lipoprotein NlpI
VESWTRFLEIVPNGREALHNRAWNYMYMGARGEAAASDARRLLEIVGWRSEVSQFMVLLAHLGYRQAGLDREARGVLEEAATRCDTKSWPYPVIEYMRDSAAETLLDAAANNDKKTEAHTYIGMDLVLKGRIDEARGHFAWVREYGNKLFLEYPLALAELNRLGY